MDQAAAFEKLSHFLHKAQEAPTLEQSRALIAEAIQRLERLSKVVLTAAEKRGRKGGTKTAERGPDYFRQIAAMRKTRAGGRPRKQAE
jgi:molybdenum-dependent DNA-binding transcriptional regulator ModE